VSGRVAYSNILTDLQGKYPERLREASKILKIIMP
jgi:hypothetical protein